MEYLMLVVAWSGWCALHSALASRTVTAWFKRRLEAGYRFYRLFYNLLAAATLAPLVIYSRAIKGPVLFRWTGPGVAVQAALIASGLALFLLGGAKYDLPHFLGLRQIRSGRAHATLSAHGRLDTTGILGLTRHPWYLAGLILVWTAYRKLFPATLVVNLILSAYLIIGALLEERKLLIEFGDAYRRYRQEVSMFLPLKWLAARRPNR